MTNLYLAGIGLTYFPAQISTQPAGAVAFAGANTTQTVQFSVGAVGTGPLTYQWSLAGNPLANNSSFSGVTNSTLTLNILPGAANGFAGNYSVLVTGPNNSTNSANAALTVLTLPSAPVPGLVGQWFDGASNFTDVSGYSPAGSHDGYIVPSGNTKWFLTNDAPAGRTGFSFWTLTNVCGLAISNSFTLDAHYTSTFDTITNAFTVTLGPRLPGPMELVRVQVR